jgi:hypothetical protein
MKPIKGTVSPGWNDLRLIKLGRPEPEFKKKTCVLWDPMPALIKGTQE